MLRFFLSALCALTITLTEVLAADFKPLSTWPYIYEEFSEGWITTHKGDKVRYDRLNISVSTCRAHYLSGDKIMEADPTSTATVLIGDDTYILASGKLVKVLSSAAKGAVVQSVGIDVAEMSKADIGYGKSYTASTQNVALSAITSSMDFSVNKSMETVSKEKYSGTAIALDETVGLFFNGSFVPATRYDIGNIPGIDQKAFKQFVKEHKIKFSSVEDLLKVLEFLYSL